MNEPYSAFYWLTPAERAVLECLVAGATNREIGRILSRSEFAVKAQVRRIFRKTGVRSRKQLSTMALRYLACPVGRLDAARKSSHEQLRQDQPIADPGFS